MGWIADSILRSKCCTSWVLLPFLSLISSYWKHRVSEKKARRKKLMDIAICINDVEQSICSNAHSARIVQKNICTWRCPHMSGVMCIEGNEALKLPALLPRYVMYWCVWIYQRYWPPVAPYLYQQIDFSPTNSISSYKPRFHPALSQRSNSKLHQNIERSTLTLFVSGILSITSPSPRPFSLTDIFCDEPL